MENTEMKREMRNFVEAQEEIRVCVHGGLFHADDALCIGMLKAVFPDKKISVQRSRDDKVWESCNLILDVGGKQALEDGRLWLDHHQPEEQWSFKPEQENGVKPAACTLLAEVLFCEEQDYLVALKKEFLDGVSAQDNGQKLDGVSDSMLKAVHYLNPCWDEDTEEAEALFEEAVGISRRVFERVDHSIRSRQAAAEKVEKAFHERKDGVMEMPRFMPWQGIVLKQNKMVPEDDRVKMVIFQNQEKTRP